MEKQLTYKQYQIKIKGPINAKHLVYFIGGETILDLDTTHYLIITISGVDWDAQLSPWPALKVFKQGHDFGGLADTFITDLIAITQLSEQALALKQVHRILCGYSLAGLFTLYAITNTDYFEEAISCSGSLWFDGFKTYALTHPPRGVKAIYLSLGSNEKNTRNQRMQVVERVSEDVATYYQSQGINNRFELVEGGHFDNVEERVNRGLDWIASQYPKD